MTEDLPVTIDAAKARPPIELVHEVLSTGSIVVYNPDWNGDTPTEWIRSSVHWDAEKAR